MPIFKLFKSLVLITYFLFASTYLVSQNKTDSSKTKTFPVVLTNLLIVDDGCGDPSTFSQTWDYREGIVTKIVNSNTIEFKQEIINGNKNENLLTVVLVGIDVSKNEKAIRKYLVSKILNRRVDVVGNLKVKDDLTMFAVVSRDRPILEINETLVEKGIAKYKPFDFGHLIPYNKACQLEKAEGRAKKAKLGIWAK